MSVPLRSRIQELSGDFANAVLETIRSCSLEELLAETGGRRGAIALGSRGRRGPVGPRLLPSGRLHRRSIEEIAETLRGVVSLLKRHEEGMRAEQIRSELGLIRKEVPRVLREGLATKVLRAKGHKRATTYFAA